MAEKKNDTVKLYIMIGLAVALMVSGYFRFFGRKVAVGTSAAAPHSDASNPGIPRIVDKPQAETPAGSATRDFRSVKTRIRDIFAAPLPSQLRKIVNARQEASKPVLPTTMKLKGTIVGDQNPIAIIDDAFVRKGDRVGDYQVVRIAKDEVLLSSDSNRIVLRVLGINDDTPEVRRDGPVTIYNRHSGRPGMSDKSTATETPGEISQ